jgi:hypothetical protein
MGDDHGKHLTEKSQTLAAGTFQSKCYDLKKHPGS